MLSLATGGPGETYRKGDFNRDIDAILAATEISLLRTSQWSTAAVGQEGTLVKSFHSGRSIPGTLKTGHSIGPTDFAGLNFSYVEVAVIVVAQCMKFERPV